jgi:4-hydroxybenzoate polyprenyltransferase
MMIERKNWLKKIDAYERLMRLDKPVGTLLLLWPTLWALWLAGVGKPNWLTVWIFIVGTVLMRSAGCVMNDLADRSFDGRVERTQFRPLATGEVAPWEALALAGFLSLSAFCLVLALNKLTILLAIAAFFLAASYPFTKRFFAIPQAYLGIAFGFGVPMAFAAITGAIPIEAWLILAANIFWSLAYDTEYAMVDREDDLKLGLRSSAIFFRHYDVLAIMFCYFTMLSLLTYVGWRLHLHWPYYVSLLAASGLALYHFTLIRARERQRCFQAFLHNTWIGAMIFGGLVLNYIIYPATF